LSFWKTQEAVRGHRAPRTAGSLPRQSGSSTAGYCLVTDFTTNLTSGFGITISTSNVVLDLNGHTIDNLAAGTATETRGVFALRRQNITVRNGTIRGFREAVTLQDDPPYAASGGHLVEAIRADKNTYVGINVYGHGNVVRRNQVLTTGGTTALSNASGFGIRVSGPGNRVIDNDVVGVTASSGYSYGIDVATYTDDSIVLGNRITDAVYGIQMRTASTKYRDTLTTAVSYPYYGGFDAGNNN